MSGFHDYLPCDDPYLPPGCTQREIDAALDDDEYPAPIIDPEDGQHMPECECENCQEDDFMRWCASRVEERGFA